MAAKSRKVMGSEQGDRRALLKELKVVHEQLRIASKRAAILEQEKIQLKDREAKLKSEKRIEKAVFSSYAKILAAVESYEGKGKVDGEEELKSMLASPDGRKQSGFMRTGNQSPRSPRDDARSYGVIGLKIANRVEIALDQAQKERAVTETLSKKGGAGMKEVNLIKRINDLTTERDALRAKLNQAQGTIDELQKQTSEALESHYLLDKNRFKQAVLKVLAEFSSALHRRLGYIPANTRIQMNNFIEFVTKTNQDSLFFPNQHHPGVTAA